MSPKLLAALECVCGRTQDAGEVRAALDELSWSLLDAALGAATRTAIDRSARLIGQHRGDDDAGPPPGRRGDQEPRQPGGHGRRRDHRRLALCWSVGLLVIFAPLAVRLYGNKVH